ncbi:MAG: Holliday junction branch migration protein RuvA [Rhodobacter sp.]|nr:Holliday junction branch migration protein RuvA [Rhodobacter sp.]
MIGRLAGRLDYRASDHVLIDVGGVGYIVHVSDRTLAALPGVGEAVALYTELYVREDLMQLFGFTSLIEKEWHRLLMSVQGIGAKASMAILGALGPDGVGRAIAMGDATAVKAAPGVGPKIAQRVVNELKDKAPAVMAMGASGGGGANGGGAFPAADTALIEPGAATGIGAAAPPAPPRQGSAAAQAEALSALSNLGYSPGEAVQAVAEAAAATPGADTAAVIRAALKLLAPKG